MASLKTLRNRIRSVKSTRQITKAMKMVAAAKLRRSQERALATRPYSEHMSRVIRSIAAQTNPQVAPELLAKPRGNRTEILVLTADRGLCGSFNSSVVRAVRAKTVELTQQGHQVTLSCVGRRGFDVLKRQFGDRIRRSHINMAQSLSFEKAQRDVVAKLLGDFANDQFDVCFMVYNTFKSAMTQELTWKQIIPVPLPMATDEPAGTVSGSPLYEPAEEVVLAALLPQNVAVQIFQALVESDASEHGARMTAMDNAVRNSGEMIQRLNITYNRTRQAAITTELMEIISGSESLKS